MLCDYIDHIIMRFAFTIFGFVRSLISMIIWGIQWRKPFYGVVMFCSLLMTVMIWRYLTDRDFTYVTASGVYRVTETLPVTYTKGVHGAGTLKQDPHYMFPSWPSIKDTSISINEVEKKYSRCRAASVNANPNCLTIHENFTRVWRSTSQRGNTRDQDFRNMDLAASCCSFYYKELMEPAPSPEMYDWEKDYLAYPSLRSLEDIASAAHSTVTLDGRGGNATFTLGSKVKFKIVLFNGRMERKVLGGDKLEVWLVSDYLKATITADVIDNLDGTYLAATLLPWSGPVKVMAAIVHHRELFRTMLYIQRVFKSAYSFTGDFVSSRASEATPCSPFPSLPNYSADEMCNFTEVNGGFPWYCGKPVKMDYLNCSHFVSVMKLNVFNYLPLTQVEEELLHMTETQRPFLIPNNITLYVLAADNTSTTVLPLPQTKCNERNLSLTFEDSNSYGFFYQGKWRAVSCALPEIDKPFLTKCLKDTQVILVGDSNGRKQYEYLSQMVPCQEMIQKRTVTWHAPLRCDNVTNNMSIQYFPHKLPFFGSKGESIDNKVLYSEVDILNSIPGDGKYLLHLHNFLHMVPFHLSLSENRLKLIREAMKRLLARNPHVIIVYQSAHSAYDRRPQNKHKMGVFLLKMQRSILKGLGERVMFVNTWPMTVAVANDDGHPPIGSAFTKYYLGYVCGRF